MKQRSELPLVRLRLVEPLVEAVEAHGQATGPLLRSFKLKRAQVEDSDMFLPAPTLYALVEGLAELSGDPYFGVHEGDRLDPWTWAPLAGPAEAAVTVGDFLLRFAQAASENTNASDYLIETTIRRTVFSERRVTDGGVRPRHNDGYSLAFLLGILRSAVGASWDGSRVVGRVCDPGVVPPDYLGIRVAAAGSMGFSVVFPSDWLLLPPQLGTPVLAGGRPRAAAVPPVSVVDALRQVLVPHIHEHDLGAVRVAGLFGLSRRTLARRLQLQGTTLKAELAALRRSRAEEALRDASLSVAEVGARVGYPDSAVFSRAFRRWTGLTPSEFRAACPVTADHPG